MTSDWQYVDSSSIEAIRYDSDNTELYVQFISGATYVYSNVDESTVAEFLDADSKGSYFNRIIKPSYDYRQA
jgi:hypothetical protein